ncbi:TetR family transcriptional regulator [Pseudonocardia alni]|uniref:TetR family transcriptional regulator n=1 Tax=Pseudonocardia alni TaxID=33907 RepID=UPI001C53A71F
MLDEAECLFAHNGYGAVGLPTVVAGAGVTTGSPSHQFDGSAALFAAVLERWRTGWRIGWSTRGDGPRTRGGGSSPGAGCSSAPHGAVGGADHARRRARPAGLGRAGASWTPSRRDGTLSRRRPIPASAGRRCAAGRAAGLTAVGRHERARHVARGARHGPWGARPGAGADRERPGASDPGPARNRRPAGRTHDGVAGGRPDRGARATGARRGPRSTGYSTGSASAPDPTTPPKTPPVAPTCAAAYR